MLQINEINISHSIRYTYKDHKRSCVFYSNIKTAANSLALSFLKLYLLMPSKNVKFQIL